MISFGKCFCEVHSDCHNLSWKYNIRINQLKIFLPHNFCIYQKTLLGMQNLLETLIWKIKAVVGTYITKNKVSQDCFSVRELGQRSFSTICTFFLFTAVTIKWTLENEQIKTKELSK